MHHLDLSRHNHTGIDLPESPSLTHLNLASNAIKSTQGIETCYTLKAVDLSYNQIAFIESWCCLTNLQHVSLSHNGLRQASA
jgi:Leucine-rich repeat (LRR) protein